MQRIKLELEEKKLDIFLKLTHLRIDELAQLVGLFVSLVDVVIPQRVCCEEGVAVEALHGLLPDVQRQDVLESLVIS